MFTLLEQIKEQQQNHTTLLTTILSRLGQGGEIDPLPAYISFPITTDLEMRGLKDKIKDKNVQKAVVSCCFESLVLFPSAQEKITTIITYMGHVSNAFQNEALIAIPMRFALLTSS